LVPADRESGSDRWRENSNSNSNSTRACGGLSTDKWSLPSRHHNKPAGFRVLLLRYSKTINLDYQSRLHLTMAVFPSFPISVFSILLFYLPTQFSLILVVASAFFLLESSSHQKLLFVPTLRPRFARCCFWSATFLIAAKISLHIFLNIHARIEQAFHFALARICLPQLFAVQVLGIILCDGDRMHRLYFNLRLYLERNNDPASTSDLASKWYPLFS
jgi:hypothetical protein